MSGVTPGMVRCAWCPDCKKVISFDAQPIPTMIVDEDPRDGNGTIEWQCFWCGFSTWPAKWSFFMGHPESFKLKPLPEWEGEFAIGEDGPRQQDLFA